MKSFIQVVKKKGNYRYHTMILVYMYLQMGEIYITCRLVRLSPEAVYIVFVPTSWLFTTSLPPLVDPMESAKVTLELG